MFTGKIGKNLEKLKFEGNNLENLKEKHRKTLGILRFFEV